MNSQIILLTILVVMDYLQLMWLGGLCRWVYLLELFGLVDELFERARFQMAHAKSRWFLIYFRFCRARELSDGSRVMTLLVGCA